MKAFSLKSDCVSLAVTETGGQLSDVVFRLTGGREVRPMHVSPWTDETFDPDIPPMLRMLRGDFFCAPFGASDLIETDDGSHGLPAGGTWRPVASDATTLDAELQGTVLGAGVSKHVEVRFGEPVIYQRHVITGGDGRVPIGHHAMLHAASPLRLGFGPWTKALTPPDPIEIPPLGRQLLASNQAISNPVHAERDGGGMVDLTCFPTPDGFEALWMLLCDQKPAFSWTAATATEESWVWFALKDPRILPQTLFWCSNGGRDYPPWNGRHRRVIGIEDIRAYFHLGHAASIADNPVASAGSPTAVTLSPDTATTVSYLFGVADAPAGFGAVVDVAPAAGGIKLIDAGGREVFAPCDPSFVTGRARTND